jgi:hypothetical protein
MKSQIELLIVITVVGTIACYSTVVNRAVSQTPSQRCGSIEGLVLNKMGLPVSGVKVYSEVSDRPGGVDRGSSSETDSNGRFSIGCAEAGRNGVSVSKEDEYYADTLLVSRIDPRNIPVTTVNVVEGQTVKGVVIHLPPQSGRLNIRVVDANAGGPVKDATVTVCRRNALANPHRPRCFVTHGMSFSGLMAPIDYTIKASAPGYIDWHFSGGLKGTEPFIRLARAMTRDIIIPLRPVSR